MISDRTVERLSLYRWLLEMRVDPGTVYLFSHQLASMASVSPAQLRRDLMAIGYSGSPSKGYLVKDLAGSIGSVLDGSEPSRVALVGMGNLGRAIVSFVRGRKSQLQIVATFDTDCRKTGRVISGCRCYNQDKIEEVVEKEKLITAVITVPCAEAQKIADRLVNAGVRGILNYAPVPLRVPEWVYLENRDVTAALEKVAYFARQEQERK